MDAWQEEGQIIFSCLLCSFCSVNQLFSSESKNLFQDVNKSKVIRKGNVIPLCCSSCTHISKWKLFKDTTWHRLIGDESFGTWSWKCLLKWVALWLFAGSVWSAVHAAGSGRRRVSPAGSWAPLNPKAPELAPERSCLCLELTVLLDHSQFGQCLPGLNPECLT